MRTGNSQLVGRKINGSWYHFKDNGTMSTGWVKDGLHYNYLKASGEMQTGWLRKWNMVLFGEFRGYEVQPVVPSRRKVLYVNASGALSSEYHCGWPSGG